MSRCGSGLEAGRLHAPQYEQGSARFVASLALPRGPEFGEVHVAPFLPGRR